MPRQPKDDSTPEQRGVQAAIAEMRQRADNPRDAGLTKLFTIPIPFKLISKSNEKTAGRYLSAKYRVFEESIAFLAKATCGELKLKEGWVVIRPAFKNKVHSDFGNLNKGCLDGLKKGGVLWDDKYIACTVTPAVYGHNNNEIEIWGIPRPSGA